MPIEYVNLPEWNGQAKHLTDVWRLRKGDRQALRTLSTHPIGGEIRVTVDGELLQRQCVSLCVSPSPRRNQSLDLFGKSGDPNIRQLEPNSRMSEAD